MDPRFSAEFEKFKFPYPEAEGEGYRWFISADMVDRSNELTKNRTWAPHPENLWDLRTSTFSLSKGG